MNPPLSIEPERALLRDGKEVRLRFSGPTDGALYFDFFGGLSEQSRDFMHGWSRMRSREQAETLALKTRCNDHLAILALPSKELGRVAGYCWLEGIKTAETPMLGIGIIDAFHEVGLGKVLLRAMLTQARMRGLPQVRLGVWTDNARAMHVYRSVGFHDDPSYPAKDFDGRTELYMVADTGAAGASCPREFPLIALEGKPYEMGYQHGVVLRGRIAQALKIVARLLPVPMETAMRYASRSAAYCNDRAPELMEELRGIADGSGFSAEEIFMLNASLDLIGSAPRVKEAATRPDCWAIAISSPITADGNTFVTWTAEDSEQWREACVLLHLRPQDGVPCLVWTFAGFVGRPGFNPEMALAAACRLSNDCGDGLPYPFVCREALRCKTVAEAARVIASSERMSGMTYILGDRKGGTAVLDTSAHRIERRSTAPGYAPCAGRWEEQRLPRLDNLLQPHRGCCSRGDLERILRDHGPGALCPHDGTGMVSLATWICDLHAAALWVTYGSACQAAYVPYTL
jgi:isopenicillin-N N-acyltransferase-like protein